MINRREAYERLENLLKKAMDPACSPAEAQACKTKADKLAAELGIKRRKKKRKEKLFVKGLYTKAPQESSPEWVMFTLNINRVELIDWLLTSGDSEWINAQVCKSRGTGNFYAEVNQWEDVNT